MNDVFKLENVVEGMKIITKGKLECDTCVQGKMSQYRNREPDRGATSLLQLVHGDLAGPKLLQNQRMVTSMQWYL